RCWRTKSSCGLLMPGKETEVRGECVSACLDFREVHGVEEDAGMLWNYSIQNGDQCKPNPCQYGGTCKDGIGTYTCTCLDGYQGKNCESVIPKYCKLNNGDCDHFCRPIRNDVECFCMKQCTDKDGFSHCFDSERKLDLSVSSFANSSSVTSEQDDSPDLHLQNETKAPDRKETDPKTNVSPNPHTRIVGGDDCLPGECPWQALLINENKEGFCGGTILSQFYILTAAHCINQSKIIKVVVVDRDKEENTEMMYSVEKIFVHGRFVSATYDYDIALIKLKEPIKFSIYVIPACLPDADFANEILMNQKSGTVSGFGRLYEHGRVSNKLKVLQVPYIDRNSCKQITNFAITENMLCAGYDNITKDACQGDSGVPHVTKYKDTYFVTGIVSWGEGCARKGKYGVYTKVSKFHAWLKRIFRLLII
uniref:Coagulation factor X n=1 Tax=Gopherus agassizii TaxID=38772 RepID=A0A452H761_9SAUR